MILDADRLASPDIYPLSFDTATQQVGFVTLDEPLYHAASFLDERILAEAGPQVQASWPELLDAASGLGGECDFIFHIGHTGSTLLSRLLGQSERVFCLREPAVLRTLAQAEPGIGAERVQAWAVTFLKLWGRVYRPEQKTLLKATSFAAELAPMLLRLNPSGSAILMLVGPGAYLAGILAGEASREESRTNAPMRLARLHRRLGREAWRLDQFSDGEAAAMGWLCEVATLAKVGAAFPQRVLWLDFDAFLAQPAAGLAAALRRLHGAASEAQVCAMLQSPEMSRYSKAPEFGYDAGLRRRVLAQAREDFADEIARGMAWINAAGAAHPGLAGAMRQAAAATRAA